MRSNLLPPLLILGIAFLFVVSLIAFPFPGKANSFQEIWTGSNGSSWPNDWNFVVLSGHIHTIDIQGNRGRIAGAIEGISHTDRILALYEGREYTNMESALLYANPQGSLDRANAGLVARVTTDDPGTYYGLLVDNFSSNAKVGIYRVVDGSATQLVDLGTVAQPYALRFNVQQRGIQTILKAKAWPAGTSEPASWQGEVLDGEPRLQNRQGKAGLRIETPRRDFIDLDDFSAQDTGPSVFNARPSGTFPSTTAEITLSAETNVSAICRYSTQANTLYENMTRPFSQTGGTIHVTTIVDFTKGAENTYYIRCIDGAGNASIADTPITFAVLGADSASTVKSGSWSDPTVWSSGNVPGSIDQVTINSNHTVTYDVTDSRVSGATVQINGKLVFSPSKTVTLQTDKNIVVRGVLEMKPSSAAVNHTIRFVDVDELAFIGGGMDPMDTDIGLWVEDSGRLDIAGTSKTSWTRLAGSASAGSNTITLESAPAGWRVGDELSIVPTEPPSVGTASWNGFELRTIAAISGSTVTLNSSLSRNHPAATDPNTKRTFTAEVLNLTRNVHIEGTGDGSADPRNSGRAHIWVRSSVPQFVSYAELKLLGPRKYSDSNPTSGVLGRYPIHFHHSMNGSRGSLVEGTIVRNAGNRAFVPHASHGITFRDTIAYDVWDDAYWWDPPPSKFDTTNNSNDTLYDRAVAAILKSDPAFRGYGLTGFQLEAGSDNEIRNSVAVGVRGNANASGFHWPSTANQNQGGNVWIFNQGNIAHNNKVHGIFTWQNDGNIHIVENAVLYHNGDSGVDHGAYGNNYQYIDIAAFGNGNTGLEVHAAAPNRDIARVDGYSLVFENYISDGKVLFPKHNAKYELPALLKDCIFSGVIVNDAIGSGIHSTRADFVNCVKPDGSSIEPSDFTLQNVLPGLDIRVQRPGGTAYHLTNGGVVTAIAAFYGSGFGEGADPDPGVSLSASPSSIVRGEFSRLSWNSMDADTCNLTFEEEDGTINTLDIGNRTSGSITVTPAETTVYDINCSNATKSITESVTVVVTRPLPTATLTASATSIDPGESITLAWSSTDADQCTGTNFSTAGSVSGSAVFFPSDNTSYVLDCIQSGVDSNADTKIATASVTVFLTGAATSVSLEVEEPRITSFETSYIFLDRPAVVRLSGSELSAGEIFKLKLKHDDTGQEFELEAEATDATSVEVDFSKANLSAFIPGFYEVEIERELDGSKTALTEKILLTKLGDLARTGRVDLQDVSLLLSLWNSTQAADLDLADLSGPAGVPDGLIDIWDANTLMRNWTG